MVVLLSTSEADASLRPAAVSKLARLGVTSVALARDEGVLALVVEGWAFEPRRSADAVVAAFAGDGSSARTLHAIAEMTVSTAAPPSGSCGDDSEAHLRSPTPAEWPVPRKGLAAGGLVAALILSAVALGACGGDVDESSRTSVDGPKLPSARAIDRDPHAIACGHVRDQQKPVVARALSGGSVGPAGLPREQ